MPSGRERLSLRTEPEADAEVFEALVTKSDTSGVWVTKEKGDPSNPLGPCKGATRTVLSGGVLVEVRIPDRTRVLVALTKWGPWIVREDREVT